MVNVLSAVHNPTGLLVNLAKGLKPEGRLVIIDWNPGKLGRLAEGEGNFALRLTLRQIHDADFEAVKILDFLPAQTIWICRRRDRG